MASSWLVCCFVLAFCFDADGAALDDYACDKNFEKVGCYKDRMTRKQERRDFTDVTSFRGEIDWGNLAPWLESLACACASIARKGGSPYFGLQYVGECWTGTRPGVKYGDPEKASKGCRNHDNQPCDSEDVSDNSTICFGRAWRNYIYKLTEVCKDVLPDKCAKLASEGFCTPDYSAVLKQCPKSCKLC